MKKPFINSIPKDAITKHVVSYEEFRGYLRCKNKAYYELVRIFDKIAGTGHIDELDYMVETLCESLTDQPIAVMGMDVNEYAEEYNPVVEATLVKVEDGIIFTPNNSFKISDYYVYHPVILGALKLKFNV